jgi:hypothetical protein
MKKNEPTIKQKRYVRGVLENLGSEHPETEGEIALKSGYSEAMAKNPQMIRRTKGVQALFSQLGITPERLVGDYKELLDLPLKGGKNASISVDQKRKLLSDLSDITFKKKDVEFKQSYEFIKQFYANDSKAQQEEFKNAFEKHQKE